MKKRPLAIIVILGCFLSFSAYAQTSSNVLTLKQCVETAIANNLQVKQSELQMQNAAINLKQARNNVLPDLFGNISHGLSQGRSIDPFTNAYVNQNIFYGNYNLSTNFTLFNGYQIKNFIKQSISNYSASQQDLQTAKDNLTLNIILAYLQILNNQEQLEQSRNQVALTKKQVERLEILNKEGSIIPAQLYELRGQLANDELAVINNENAVEASKLALTQLMNVPYNKNMEVEKLTADNYAMNYLADVEVIYQAAVSNLAQIKAAEFREESAENAIKVARGELYPGIGLGANLNTNYSSAAMREILLGTTQVPSGDFVTVNGNQIPVFTTKSNFNSERIGYVNQFTNNYNTSVGMSIRVPILNAFRARNNIALAKSDLKNTEYIAETAKIQLRQSIEQAHFNMTAAYRRYTTLLQQVADFSEAFRGAEVRYNEGVSTQVDYLIAKNNVERARINLISAKYDYVFQTKILDYYQSKLIF